MTQEPLPTRRLISLVFALWAFGASPAFGAAVIADSGAPTTVSRHDDVAAWSRPAEGGGHELVVREGGGKPRVLPVERRGVPFDADVGPGPDGGTVIAYSRCETEPKALDETAPMVAHVTGRGCDLFLYDLDARAERRLDGASTAGASEVLPSVWRDEVAFARVYERRSGRSGSLPYLYRRPLDGSRGSQRQPGGARGGSGLPGPTALDLYGRHLAFAWVWSRGGRGQSELRLDTLGRGPLVVGRTGWRDSVARYLTPHGSRGRIAYGLQRVVVRAGEPRSLASQLRRYRISNRAKERADAPAFLTAAAHDSGETVYATAPGWSGADSCTPACEVIAGDDPGFVTHTAVLPGGGRSIVPDRRVVAFYGAPQSDRLGALGQGSAADAARRLRRYVAAYERAGGRPVLPAFELISSIALASPGRDGLYRSRQSDAVIRRYLRGARAAGALLILDVQPGRADFMDEVRALREHLKEPDVSLAIDPEWSMDPGEVPGDSIGGTDARTVNRISAYLERLVRRHHLPQKLLLVHRFTDGMISGESRIERREGVVVVESVDGFGTPAAKRSKYEHFTRRGDGMHEAFKLFFEEDTNRMSVTEVMRLRPRPDVVIYE
jgi:hypothetical protein